MAYVSRKYLSEKWDKLKWDMENILLEGDEDEVPEEDVERCAANVIDMCESIAKEVGKVYVE